MRKPDVIKAITYTLAEHRYWAVRQQRRLRHGKKAIPHVGGETFHRERMRACQEAIRLLTK